MPADEDNSGPARANLDLADFAQESDWPTAQDWFASPLTVRERSMLALMLELKDKPEWERKVFDEDIVAKWREEALSFNPDSNIPVRTNSEDDPWNSSNQNGENLLVDGEARQKTISAKMFDHCIAELRDDAETFRKKGFTPAIDANACVYMSDTAISGETKARLMQGAERLEKAKDWQKDWHPGSDGKVLDLVHPSLFPLLYGRSRIQLDCEVPLEDCASHTGKGVVFPRPDGEFPDYSENFQWLPCQVDLGVSGKAKVSSYINNLYPKGNEDLYAAVEDVISATVPLWIDTLISTKFLTTRRIGNIPENGVEEYNQDDDDDTDRDDHDEEDHDRPRITIVPEPTEYRQRQRVPAKALEWPGQEQHNMRMTSDLSLPLKNIDAEITQDQLQAGVEGIEQETCRIREVIQKQGMQVIVKFANIHLTPEKPTYDGGSWHIEGQLNEHIVASALYYYDSSNLTASHLVFREGVDRDTLQDYEQHQFEPLLEVYGLKDSWGSAIQVLGRVHTREDRLLVFPNVLQHCVAPFALADRTKPGHRKLLALFLVDPDMRIPSTREVPPQQREWWAKVIEEQAGLTQRLPVELADQVVQGVEDFPITLEEAKELREVLIEERKVFVDYQMDTYVVEHGFAFCEH